MKLNAPTSRGILHYDRMLQTLNNNISWLYGPAGGSDAARLHCRNTLI
jgi:hypothetical protein